MTYDKNSLRVAAMTLTGWADMMREAEEQIVELERCLDYVSGRLKR